MTEGFESGVMASGIGVQGFQFVSLWYRMDWEETRGNRGPRITLLETCEPIYMYLVSIH